MANNIYWQDFDSIYTQDQENAKRYQAMLNMADEIKALTGREQIEILAEANKYKPVDPIAYRQESVSAPKKTPFRRVPTKKPIPKPNQPIPNQPIPNQNNEPTVEDISRQKIPGKEPQLWGAPFKAPTYQQQSLNLLNNIMVKHPVLGVWTTPEDAYQAQKILDLQKKANTRTGVPMTR